LVTGIVPAKTVDLILHGFIAALLVSVPLAAILCFAFPQSITPNGINAHSFSGVRRFISWNDIASIRPLSFVGLKWLRLDSASNGKTTWLSLFPDSKSKLKPTLLQLAPPDHPIRSYFSWSSFAAFWTMTRAYFILLGVLILFTNIFLVFTSFYVARKTNQSVERSLDTNDVNLAKLKQRVIDGTLPEYKTTVSNSMDRYIKVASSFSHHQLDSSKRVQGILNETSLTLAFLNLILLFPFWRHYVSKRRDPPSEKIPTGPLAVTENLQTGDNWRQWFRRDSGHIDSWNLSLARFRRRLNSLPGKKGRKYAD
jgi:hypothetical protein